MNKKLLEILACPACKGALIYDSAEQGVICRFDKWVFPVRNDIPVMLLDEARPLEEK